ncbi:ParB N-terminal domain-containing protein [Conexibacter sp. CPCC 206217]|uniref:ParB N-terminal domain-containing protein n=1 Tax=Conexibacter sp. CPCC 206217 TaxID=3064574 RepID=UPI002727563B|nr:ParB N-terminal domain-containing protein [Conexibacter sp. CPCC 206217]MDO8208968.1 ParB N-terminal domain-containing protein [Conexibacter sp. CPCC 206217]
MTGSMSPPALFDVTDEVAPVKCALERIPLSQLRAAPNPRREISHDGIVRLARMLMMSGQTTPVLARRTSRRVVTVYAGQRRLLAARLSVQLAGEDGFEGLRPVLGLNAVMLDHRPSLREIRRIQAQENQREGLSLRDLQDQFRDVWDEFVGLPDDERIAAVCEELGHAPKLAHNLRRQCTLPERVRHRVADKPSDDQLSIGTANRLAEMATVAPQLAEAVADRVSTPELHAQLQHDLGAFVQRTVVEDEQVYAVRLDEGDLLDTDELLRAATNHLGDDDRARVSSVLACDEEDVDRQLVALRSKTRTHSRHVRVEGSTRDRAANGDFAWVYDRGGDFAPTVWLVDPVFAIDLVHGAVAEHEDRDDGSRHADESYFGAARLQDQQMQAATEEAAEARRRADRVVREAISANLALGLDIRAGLLDVADEQLSALREVLCRLLARDYPEVIAFGAGWSDRDLQRAVGDSGRQVPVSTDEIVSTELDRALSDRDPLRGLAGLLASFCAAFVLDPQGIPATKHLGTDRAARHLRRALPGGATPLRTATWQFMRPMLNPHLVETARDAFVFDVSESTVDLADRDRAVDLDEIDLGDGDLADAA